MVHPRRRRSGGPAYRNSIERTIGSRSSAKRSGPFLISDSCAYQRIPIATTAKIARIKNGARLREDSARCSRLARPGEKNKKARKYTSRTIPTLCFAEEYEQVNGILLKPISNTSIRIHEVTKTNAACSTPSLTPQAAG